MFDVDRSETSKIPSLRTETTFAGSLREEKIRLEKRLADINAVLAVLEEAPQIVNVLEALKRLGY